MGVSRGRYGDRAVEGAPLERFKPTTGIVAGWAGVGLAVLAVGYVVVAGHTVGGLRLALGAAFGGVVVWTTQIRPRVTAYADSMVLHGTVSDTVVPYAAVNQVTMGQTLNVWVGQKRYVCVGIGRSVGAEARQRVRSRGSGDLLGMNRAARAFDTPEAAPSRSAGTQYHAFVLNRITDLVVAARKQADHPGADLLPRAEVSRHVAVLELTALVVTGAAFVLSFLLH